MQSLSIDNNEHEEKFIKVAKSLYSAEAIRNASMAFVTEAKISVEDIDSHSWGLHIAVRTDTFGLNDIATRLLDKLLETQTNIDLNERFGSIRNTIVEAAFAPLKGRKPV